MNNKKQKLSKKLKKKPEEKESQQLNFMRRNKSWREERLHHLESWFYQMRNHIRLLVSVLRRNSIKPVLLLVSIHQGLFTKLQTNTSIKVHSIGE